MSAAADPKSRAALIPLLAGLALFFLFIALGRWQLERANEKAVLFESFDVATEASLQRGPVDDETARRQRFSRITVFGRYDTDHQFLLDNMVSNGRVGYQVLTPLQVEGEERMLLVNRGWIPMNQDRRVLPMPEAGTTSREVTGRIGRLPVAGLRAGPGLEPSATGWPRRAQFPKREELEAALAAEFFDYVLLLDPDEPDGYVREWRPTVIGADRHRGYAVQWFAMAVTVLILIVFLFLKNRKGHRNE